MQHCMRPDSDDSDEFVTRIRGGGWQGWHCEGHNYDLFIHMCICSSLYCMIISYLIYIYTVYVFLYHMYIKVLFCTPSLHY